jgi:hypothetical protein
MTSRDPKTNPQLSMFDKLDVEHWKGLPAYEQRDKSPFHSIIVHFTSEEEVAEFHALTGIARTRHRTFWFKAQPNVTQANLAWVDEAALIEQIEQDDDDAQ